MFDKATYCKTIEHAKGQGETLSEQACLSAFKIDDTDGIAKAIGFEDNMLCKVDYFLEKEANLVILLELTDLKDEIERYKQECQTIVHKKPIEQKKFRKEFWSTAKNEFSKKWNGSIAIIERLWRKTNKSVDDDPRYRLIVICKNGTDIRMLDIFNTQLNGMMGNVAPVQIYTTEEVDKRFP